MTVNASGPIVIGIDLGGTKVVSGVVDAGNRILGRAKRPTPAGAGESAILDAVADCAREAILTAMVPAEEIVGVGVGVPGTLDTDAGTIRLAPNLNVRDFPLGPRLSQVLGHPVLLRNDVRMGGYGEFKLGAGRGYREILAVFVGTGIGGCWISHGEIQTGVTGNAGEIGHILTKLGGPRCGCGNRGCLEAVASRTAITRRIRKAVKRGEATSLRSVVTSKKSRLKSRELAEAYHGRDPVAVHEVERAARALGLTIGGLINLMAPEIVIIGGGVSEALGEPWIELVRRWARVQAMADADHRVLIERSGLGDDSGLLGAALMAREYFQAQSDPDASSSLSWSASS